MALSSRGAGLRGLRPGHAAVALALLAVACDMMPPPNGPPGSPAPFKLSGIGDSMMQGANASALGEQLQHSFAQGTSPNVSSIFSRYQALGFLAGGKEFVSVSGAQMVGGANSAAVQAGRICQQAVKPDRVVLLLGANDVCNRPTVAELHPVDTFRTALKEALDTLGAPACGLPEGAWVHVLSVPRVDRLRGAGLAKDPVGVAQCLAIWSTISICTIITRETDQAVLDRIGARIDAYNQGLAAEVAAADAAHGGTGGVHFTTDWVGTTADTSAGTYAFGPADVSNVDCFHPSVTAQRKLACIAWETWELGSRDVAACLR
ncbi:MAG TPA: SGNH/GDSL hydrolase family protein [Anaeromyxobacteraceae bacterium]|nr:SGNH/GDSL hydrolase family protein [Anaeromyxobacteraceae bacterium]